MKRQTKLELYGGFLFYSSICGIALIMGLILSFMYVSGGTIILYEFSPTILIIEIFLSTFALLWGLKEFNRHIKIMVVENE